MYIKQMVKVKAGRAIHLVCVVAAMVLATSATSAFAQVVLPQQQSDCLLCHSAVPANLANLLVRDSTSCDYSDAMLYSGWGWNAALGQSCPPIDSATVDNGYDHDGSLGGSQNMIPVCLSAASDTDNDGWGWENGASCTVAAGPAQGGACVDLDGDGWGWDGQDSCIVDNTGPPVDPVCVDTDGDGYGWDGHDTCIPQGTGPVAGACTAPRAGTTLVSTTAPVRSTGNSFYPDNGPQCVVPSNQFNGPGLMFGDFLLLNNAWNGDKSSWDWSQCISLAANPDGSVVPSWDYDWGNEDDLQPGFQEWEVKSYPEIIYGVKSQSEISAPCSTTGLPVPFGEMPTIDITYNYRATQTNNRVGDLGQTTVTGGDRNVAIESFLHSSCEIARGANSNREFELMVWLEHGDERLPSGSPPASVFTDSAGRLYDVYVKGQADPGYIAYVAQNEVRNGTINWNEFFADAQSNASSYGVNRIDDSWCLANILFGSEIWWGEGSLDLDYYQITRSY